MLRRDLELADAMQQGWIPKRHLESGLTPLEARAELNRLTTVAQSQPEILKAIGRHQQLVRQVGDDLVDRSLMQAATRDRNADYFPALVLDHVASDPSLVGRPVTPLTPGPRGFLKQARGGARETIRDYIDAMGRHLADVKKATMRDDLVTDLASQYDKTAAVAEGGAFPKGHSAWTYAGQTYVIPDALRDRLTKFTQRTPDEVRALNRVTSWWKGATLRVLGLPYDVLNFTGDLANFLTGEPLRHLPKAPRRLFDAARGTRVEGSLPITSNPHLDDLRMLAEPRGSSEPRHGRRDGGSRPVRGAAAGTARGSGDRWARAS
ncbi:MAG: hypothetical protein V7647_2198 [Acidobacteriota bacterium]